MIQLVDIDKSLGGKTLMAGLSWHVDKFPRVALVGPNGAGKTTLLRIMAGEEEADRGRLSFSGEVRIGYLPQEVGEIEGETALAVVEGGRQDLIDAEREIDALQAALGRGEGTEAMTRRLGELQSRFEVGGGYRFRSEARQILSHLGFAEDTFERAPSTFSGGWRMRIMLARLLVQKPELLLLDEPTNHLDLEALAWLEGFLDNYPGCVVFVSHDRAFLNRTAKAIAALDDGQLRQFEGNYDQFLVRLDEEAEQLAKLAEAQGRKVAELQRFIDRFRAKASKAKQAQSRVKQLEKMERIEAPTGAQRTVHFKLPEARRGPKLVAELVGVRKAYGDNVVYESVDFRAYRDERIALVGPNGAGKSTLLKLLTGALPFERGERRVGEGIELGHFAQHQVEAFDMSASVLQSMLAANKDGAPMTTVRGVLGAFLFGELDMDKPVGVLSGGEKNRLALARILLGRPNFLLMDEPTNHLDLASRDALEEALASYGGCLVFISHDRYFINRLATRVVHVEHGALVDYPGNWDDYVVARRRELGAASGAEIGPGDSATLAETSSAPEPPGSSRKARRRALAELRERRRKATAMLRREVDTLEAKVAEHEAGLAEAEAQLSDPAVYQDGRRVEQLSTRRAQLADALESLMDAWSEAQARLDAADAVFAAEEAALDAGPD